MAHRGDSLRNAVVVTLPDPATPTPTEPSCVGPECRCEHLPVGAARWCCDACRERHRPTRRRRRDDERPRGDRRRSPRRKRVGGVDGETIDNRYVLLNASTDDGDEWRAENPLGLSTAECFAFLTALPSDVVWWGFAFRYDVNMMLRDVPPHLVERLQIEGVCYWGAYRIEYHGKRLLISKRKGSGAHRRVVASFTLWDVFPWVQTSFVKWLRKWELAGERTIGRIDGMKNLRSSFNPSQRSAIRKYCAEECRLLAKGARRLMELIDVTGLPVRAYNSPASVAKAAMTRYGVLDYKTSAPDEVEKLIDQAYHGGRAELAEVGLLEGPFYAYDLNSAYPAMAVDLPCLAHGHWTHEPDSAITFYSLCKVSWQSPEGATWGPFPVNPKVGSKRYPTSGTGWYWGREVAAARRHAKITVKDVWTFVPRCHHKPFAYLTELYDLRRQLQDQGDQAQIIYKLALNSTYGALAEHPHLRHGEMEMPKHRCMMWAGLICAGVRAQLLDVLDDDVVFLATDCALSRKPLQVNTGDELGAWGHDPAKDVFDRMLVFGTGRLFKSVGGTWIEDVKSRGFSPKDINRQVLETVWRTDGRAGTYSFARQRFVGYGTALRRIGGMWPPDIRNWRTFVTEQCVTRFDMTPRRAWATDDVHDGKTVAPSLASHKATEKADRAKLAKLYECYNRDRLRLHKAENRPMPDGRLSPFAEKWRERCWRWAMQITAMSGTTEHGEGGRLLPYDCEPVAWGDDF